MPVGIMGSVGHSRAFAAFAAAGVIGAAAHPILVGPLYWSALRVLTGLAVAGCYTVVEAWLNSKATNETRARTFGVYRVVGLVASLLSQIMIGVLEPSSYVSFNILAILCCASLIPLALTTTRQPDTPASPRLRPLKTFRLSPLGALGVMVSGVTMPAFRMVGPIYGQEMGLDTKQIGFFCGIRLVWRRSGSISGRSYRRQGRPPQGADRHLRAGRSGLFCNCFGPVETPGAMMAMAVLFGLTAIPVFSISAAHANDFADAETVVELAASLMFLYGIGAIASPLLASFLIEEYGPGALFALIGAAHVGLLMFGLARMRACPLSDQKTPYLYTPRTSFIIGRLLRKGERSAGSSSDP
jgi:MFS family permease